ncbi:hypothetical protein ABT340_41285 [Streptosporangium sp. NPDC000239]|uniref:DUF6197 family protein n=1 Tax=Streptosporangium sp. NPDC000239 TaxID=3154248 RepID=UPI00332DA19E
MTVEVILNAAVGVLENRGRCFNDYTYADQVCVLGALAVAAGFDPDCWMGLQELAGEDRTGAEQTLIDAAQRLASVVAPRWADSRVEDLCVALGDWHDGERHVGDVRPTDSQVRDALLQAATRVEAAA